MNDEEDFVPEQDEPEPEVDHGTTSRVGAAGPMLDEPPSPINPPTGCPFHPRCPHRLANCSKVKPEAVEVSDGHFSACHLHGV